MLILENNGVTLNHDKCVYGVKEIESLGHKLSQNGITLTEDKVVAVEQEEEVRSFLGLITYVAKFIPHLATITEPLRYLAYGVNHNENHLIN